MNQVAVRRTRLPILVMTFIATVGIHIQLGDVTGSDLAHRSQIVVADLSAAVLVVFAGGAMVNGPLRRWLAFFLWLSINALMWGEIGRYALVNKLIGLGLLVWACSALVIHLRRLGEPAVRLAIDVFITVAAVEAAVAIAALEFAPGTTLPFHVPLNFGGLRASGFMVDPNAFGGFVGLALVLSWGTARRSVHHWWYRGRELVLLAAVFLSYSRTVWASLVVAGAYLLITASARTRVRVVVFAAAAGMVYLTAKVSIPVDRQLVVRSFTIGQRTSGAETAVQEWRSSPITGIGVGKYVARHDFIVHNTGLWVLTELGAIGFGLLLYATMGLIGAARRARAAARDLSRGLTAGLIAVGMMGLGIEIMYQRYVWLLFAMIYATGEPRAPMVHRATAPPVSVEVRRR